MRRIFQIIAIDLLNQKPTNEISCIFKGAFRKLKSELVRNFAELKIFYFLCEKFNKTHRIIKPEIISKMERKFRSKKLNKWNISNALDVVLLFQTIFVHIFSNDSIKNIGSFRPFFNKIQFDFDIDVKCISKLCFYWISFFVSCY